MVARHKAEAQGGFGGTSECAAGAADPTCLEEAERAPEDREDQETTPSPAKMAQSQRELRPAMTSASPEPEESWQMEEKCIPEENPMTGACHPYLQPWDPTPAQNKHHSSDSERTQIDRSSPATSCEANRRPPGAESIPSLSPDWGETEHL